ncbi:hypothetical protein J537_1296 [Acinetobacter baumannii 1437282]|nr:hypothetical protein J537_1296 [Acinetobacter baumannii 1437282]
MISQCAPRYIHFYGFNIPNKRTGRKALKKIADKNKKAA